MSVHGFKDFYDGDFEQFLAEDHTSETGEQDARNAMLDYAIMFHEPFINLCEPPVTASMEELYHWASWCIFYGRPKNEYPFLNQN